MWKKSYPIETPKGQGYLQYVGCMRKCATFLGSYCWAE